MQDAVLASDETYVMRRNEESERATKARPARHSIIVRNSRLLSVQVFTPGTNSGSASGRLRGITPRIHVRVCAICKETHTCNRVCAGATRYLSLSLSLRNSLAPRAAGIFCAVQVWWLRAIIIQCWFYDEDILRSLRFCSLRVNKIRESAYQCGNCRLLILNILN